MRFHCVSDGFLVCFHQLLKYAADQKAQQGDFPNIMIIISTKFELFYLKTQSPTYLEIVWPAKRHSKIFRICLSKFIFATIHPLNSKKYFLSNNYSYILKMHPELSWVSNIMSNISYFQNL